MNMKKHSGFTLIELMMVIVIISILVTLIIPNLLTSKARANEAAAQSEISGLTQSLTLYESARGAYPPGVANDSSAILVYELQGNSAPSWQPPNSVDNSKIVEPPDKQYFSFKGNRLTTDHTYLSPLGFPYYYREYYSAGCTGGAPFSKDIAQRKVANRDGFDIWTRASKTLIKDDPDSQPSGDAIKNMKPIICNW